MVCVSEDHNKTKLFPYLNIALSGLLGEKKETFLSNSYGKLKVV